jgi:hypothetical protein
VLPCRTDSLAGDETRLGAEKTVNVAGFVVAEPSAFVNTASYSLPESAGDVVNEYEPEVAPPIAVQLDPESVETSHCKVGTGVPDAAASNVTDAPLVTDCDDGCWVIAGGTSDGACSGIVGGLPAFDGALDEGVRPCSAIANDLRASPLAPAL